MVKMMLTHIENFPINIIETSSKLFLMNGGRNMKIDSMDAQTSYVPPTQQSHQPAPQPVAVVNSDEGIAPASHVAKLDGVDISSGLHNKSISDMTEVDRQQLSVSQKSLIDAIEKANKAASGRNTSFRFSVHEATHRISVKVLDKETNEVIREIPPEKVLDMVAKMWEMAGLFVDEKR